MTAILKALPAKGPEVNDDVVEMLTEALEKAKNGEIRGLALITDEGGSCSHQISGIKNRWEFIGHLSKIVHLLHVND